LPPGLQRRIVGTRRALFTADTTGEGRLDYVGETEDRWHPEALPKALVPIARKVLADLDAYLTPVEPDDDFRLLGRIAALLEHYPSRDRASTIEEALALDWAEDLCEYPMWAVEEACRRWRRDPSKTWRPTPGQIRSLCEDLVSIARKEQERLRMILEIKSVG
jgi:hypothetical protein